MAEIEFHIEHLDPMGQGVYKKNDDVYFIPKTLPGEEGSAQIVNSSKGVNFAKLRSLKTKSTTRIESVCPHYKDCSGCHYLHTSYEEEKEYKKQSYRKVFQFYMQEETHLECIWNEDRFHYRNRIQLHYDLGAKKLGFFIEKSKNILEIPSCLIPEKKIQNKLKELYHNQAWLKLAPRNKRQGHLELYLKDAEVELFWNQNYAAGGFTQVNANLNEKMTDYLLTLLKDKEFSSICDLFGGKGNFSQKFMNEKRTRVVADIYNTPMSKDFFSLNLYEDGALQKFQKKFQGPFDLMIVDPPRSGFKELKQWLETYKPKYLAYISCHPQTQSRDLRGISGYQFKNFCLIDLFPSTFHFESLILLERV